MAKTRKQRTVRFTEATEERLAALTELLELPSQNTTLEYLIKQAAMQAGIEKSAAKRLQATLNSLR